MITFVIIVFCVFLVAILATIHEFKNAIEVDPKAPFLYGDYDGEKDTKINGGVAE